MNRPKEYLRRILFGPRLRPAKGEVFLDLGCGSDKQEGCVGVDRRRLTCVDVVADLDGGRYPFGDSSVDGIVSYHLVEHLGEIPEVLSEMHRIVRPGGTVHLETPHYASWASWADLTHRHHLGVSTILRLIGDEHWDENLQKKYDLQRVYLRYGMLAGIPAMRLTGLEFVVNLAPSFMERVGVLHFPMGGLDLCVDLKVVK